MGAIDFIENSPEYRASVSETAQTQGQTQASQPTDGLSGSTQNFDPVLDAEKSDVQFWLDVAQTVLLLIIVVQLTQQ